MERSYLQKKCVEITETITVMGVLTKTALVSEGVFVPVTQVQKKHEIWGCVEQVFKRVNKTQNRDCQTGAFASERFCQVRKRVTGVTMIAMAR